MFSLLGLLAVRGIAVNSQLKCTACQPEHQMSFSDILPYRVYALRSSVSPEIENEIVAYQLNRPDIKEINQTRP